MTGDRKLTPEEMKLFMREAVTQRATLDAMKILQQGIVDGHDEPSLYDIAFIEVAARLDGQKDWITFLSRRILKLETLLEGTNKK